MLLARSMAVGLLLTTLAATGLVVTASGSSAPLPADDATFLAVRLAAADRQVRGHLAGLGPAATTAPARVATRAAMATAHSVAAHTREATGPQADALRRAAAREVAFLDAVGSTLANPASALRAQLPARDAALRQALAALPLRGAPAPAAGDALVAYARSRTG